MKPLKNKRTKTGLNLIPAFCIAALLFGATLRSDGQVIRPSMPMPSPPSSSGSSSSSSSPSSPGGGGSGPWVPSEPLSSANTTTNGDEVLLSFQGANIDMVIQWLTQTTGKTVVKHPQVQCQLTIASTKKLTPREAINVVYRALALEGHTVIESSRSILIVPEGKEPRMSPELIEGPASEIPAGRQRLAKVFSLKHIQASEIREKIRAALSDKASIDVDERANQIIIADYNDNIRVVGQLIEALDSDRPEDVGIRVIALKNIGAQDLARQLAPLYQKINSKTPKDTIDVAADDRSNSLIVLSSEASFNAVEKVIRLLDTEDAQDKIMRTFELKNADAQDVAKQLQELSQTSSTSSRYVYYFSSPGPDTGKKMSVVADRRRNSVIVQAPPAQMDKIAEMIADLDQAIADGGLAPKIFRLKYVSAVDIEAVLNELFLKKQQTRSYWDYVFDYDSGGGASSGGQDAGRLFGKVRITSEPFANAIIVTSNSKENLAVVEDVLNQLDQPSAAGESTLRVGLRFAKAATVARAINILFAKDGSPALRPPNQPQQGQGGGGQQQQNQQNIPQSGFDLQQEAKEEGYFPWLGGQADGGRTADGRPGSRPVSDLVGRVRTVADDRSNALLLSANVHYFPQILRLIDDMDAPTDQVLIEARLVEVTSDFLDKLGVRWSPDGSQFTADDLDNAALIKAGGEYHKGFGSVTTVNNPSGVASSLTSPASLLAALRSGVVDSTISLDFLVQFLRKTTDATVLAEPQINIRDNETGRLFVGQQVPVLTASQNSGSIGFSRNFTYKNVGVILEVTPHINNDGDVELRIHAESSTVVPGVTILEGAVFDTRTFRTDLRAKNGQTLVLGGIIQKQVSDTLRKTPILGSIPGIGWAFKKKDRINREVELMVFLRPRVIRTTEDANDLLNDITQRAPRMKKWEHDSQPQPKSNDEPTWK